jgi:ankyrin repeat protein
VLDAGANLQAKDTLRGTTALIWVAEENHLDVVKLLDERGADLTALRIEQQRMLQALTGNPPSTKRSKQKLRPEADSRSNAW